jgi:BirA family biotin operon repressor/biotin-[acetyl-CoA-carboxylase] ligase
MTEAELPVPHATSLSIESGEEPDRIEVFFEVLASIREAYDAWQAGGDLNGMRLAESYTKACVTVGKDVRVDLPDGSVLEGRAVDIDPAGQLVVRTTEGDRHIGAGDVLHVRARQ